MDMWLNGQVDRWTSGPAKIGQVDKWTGGHVVRWADGQVDRVTSGQVYMWTGE